MHVTHIVKLKPVGFLLELLSVKKNGLISIFSRLKKMHRHANKMFLIKHYTRHTEITHYRILKSKSHLDDIHSKFVTF